jgi:VanZ family protein
LFEFLEKRKVWLIYIPLIIYWLVLFVATSLPVERLPSVGFSDKINHFLAYFVLAVLVNLTLIYQRKSKFLFEKAHIATIAICLFYGAV